MEILQFILWFLLYSNILGFVGGFASGMVFGASPWYVAGTSPVLSWLWWLYLLGGSALFTMLTIY